MELVKAYATKRGATRIALDRLTLRAPTNQITAVLGPNGAGKSTTINICAGLARPDSGRVRVLDRDPRDRALRARVGVMPQSGVAGGVGIAGATRCAEALRLFASYAESPLPTAALLERLGLTAVAETPWRRLSGGEQQRLSLAIAMVGRPEIVFLDEPTAGLDVHARLAVFDLIRELRAQGVTVVLTTHLLEEAEQLADEVVIIDRGRVVACGSPQELTAPIEDAITFTGPPNLPLDSLLLALPRGAGAVESSPGRYRVSGDIDPAFLAAITAWCASHDVMPQRLMTSKRSLEDVFVEVTGGAGRQ